MCVCRTPPNPQKQAGQTEVIPSTPPPETEQAALSEISPTELRATGKYVGIHHCYWQAYYPMPAQVSLHITVLLGSDS